MWVMILDNYLVSLPWLKPKKVGNSISHSFIVTKEEQNGGTVDCLPKIWTTDLDGPFWLHAGS
jgi:hypothetical protein